MEYRNDREDLSEAIEADLPYEIDCPAILICGTKDHAGSCVRYNKAWHRKSGIPIEWIEGAGHNSNTDEPETVNMLIEAFAAKLQAGSEKNDGFTDVNMGMM